MVAVEADNARKEKLEAKAPTTRPTVDPKTPSEHEVGALNFLGDAQVSEVQEENDVLASYGPIQLDCDCDAGTRNDFRACVPIDNRDVSFRNKFLKSDLMEMEKVDPRSQADTVDSDVVEMVILF